MLEAFALIYIALGLCLAVYVTTQIAIYDPQYKDVDIVDRVMGFILYVPAAPIVLVYDLTMTLIEYIKLKWSK